MKLTISCAFILLSAQANCQVVFHADPIKRDAVSWTAKTYVFADSAAGEVGAYVDSSWNIIDTMKTIDLMFRTIKYQTAAIDILKQQYDLSVRMLIAVDKRDKKTYDKLLLKMQELSEQYHALRL